MAIDLSKTSELNKATVRRFFEAFEANDIEALEAVLDPDLVAYSHNSPEPQNRLDHMNSVRMWNAAFSATRFKILGQIAEGDKVATLVILSSVHDRGEFQGLPPSGRKIEIMGSTFELVRDGRIAERRVISDWLGMMQQLGLLPPPS